MRIEHYLKIKICDLTNIPEEEGKKKS